MYKITLMGPKTTLYVETDNRELFREFILWLNNSHYLDSKIAIGEYKLESDNRIKACRIKARRIGLKA